MILIFYGLLKEYGIELEEALRRLRLGRLEKKEGGNGGVKMLRERELCGLREWVEMDKASPFYYRKFGDVGEYYGEVVRLAG